MSIISIPHCFLPNSKVQEIDMNTCLRSEFQINELKQISEREDFAYFVVTQDVGRECIIFPEFKGPYIIMWYSKEGTCHYLTIGVYKILNQGFIKGEPDALTHVVYTSRCK